MTSRIRRFALVAAVLALLLATWVPAASAQTGLGRVRFVHALASASPIDIYVDDALVVRALAYGEASPFFRASPATYSVRVTQTGLTTPLWQQQVVVADESAETLIVSTTSNLTFQTFTDDLAPLNDGQARLTAIHAIPDGPTVDVVLADGRAVITGLPYGIRYGTLDIPAAAYEFFVTAEAATVEDALLGPVPVRLDGGTSYTLLAYGTAGDPRVLLLDAPATRTDEAGYVQFVHAAGNVPPVDILVDGIVGVPRLTAGEATTFIAFTAGMREFSVTPIIESDPVLGDELEIEAGSYTTVAVVLEDGEPVFQIASHDLDALREAPSLLLVNSTDTDASAGGDGETFAANIEPGITRIALEPGLESLDVSAGDVQQVIALPGSAITGVVYTVVVTETEGLLAVTDQGHTALFAMLTGEMASEPSLTEAAISPAEAAATEVVAGPTETPAAQDATAGTAATEAPTATTEPETPVPATPAPAVPLDANPIARVLVDPGSNLHIRQYPSSQSLSLLLAPSGAEFDVLGRQGPRQPLLEETPDPEATPFVDPASALEANDDLPPGETWLYIRYDAPDGGEVEGWVNALYLAVTDPAGGRQRLADLPLVPENAFGTTTSSYQPTPVPTQAFADQIVATVQLDSGANLHLRRNPASSAESLTLIPSGTQVAVTGRNEAGDWLQAEYNGVSGWISSLYVSLTFNGSPYALENVPLIVTEPTATPTATATGG